MFSARSKARNESFDVNDNEEIESLNEEQLLSDINKLRQKLNWLDILCNEQKIPRKKQISLGLGQVRQQLDELEILVNERSPSSVLQVEPEITFPSITENNKFVSQFSELTQRLFNFIQEQTAFNHRIEERLNNADNLLVADLNSAYRQITILQSEINTLQSENGQLLSSLQNKQDLSPNFVQTKSNLSHEKLKNSRTKLGYGSTPKLNVQRQSSTENIASPRPTPVHTKYSSFDDYNLRIQSENSSNQLNLIEVSAKIDIQLLTFLRYHLKEKFNQYLLDLIRDQTVCLIKDKIITNSFIESTIEQNFHQKFQKYLGLSVRKHGTSFLDDLSFFVRQILIENKDQINRFDFLQNLSAESNSAHKSFVIVK